MENKFLNTSGHRYNKIVLVLLAVLFISLLPRIQPVSDFLQFPLSTCGSVQSYFLSYEVNGYFQQNRTIHEEQAAQIDALLHDMQNIQKLNGNQSGGYDNIGDYVEIYNLCRFYPKYFVYWTRGKTYLLTCENYEDFYKKLAAIVSA
jgi:hypothetical protein